jgi:hypothetical protein
VMRFATATRAAVVAGSAMLALTGCIKQDVKATVAPTGKVTGVMAFGYDKRALAELGLSPTKVLADQVKSLKKTKLPKGVTAKATLTKGYVMTTYNMKNVSPATFSLVLSNTGGLGSENLDRTPVLTNTGTSWLFELGSALSTEAGSVTGESAPTTVVDPTATTVPVDPNLPTTIPAPSEEDESAAALARIFEVYPPKISISMTFPGAVTEADVLGVISGKNVTWTLSPKLDENLVLRAVADLK